MAAMQDLQTLYESLGGEETLAQVVEEFYERVLSDPPLAPYFRDIEMARLLAHQQSFLSAAFEGPDSYHGRELAEAHKGMGITQEQFERLTQHLFETLRGLGAEDAHIRVLESRLRSYTGAIVEA